MNDSLKIIKNKDDSYTAEWDKEDPMWSFMNGRKWWNDGMTEKLCVDSPGNMWNIGRLYRPKDLNGKFV